MTAVLEIIGFLFFGGFLLAFYCLLTYALLGSGDD